MAVPDLGRDPSHVSPDTDSLPFSIPEAVKPPWSMKTGEGFLAYHHGPAYSSAIHLGGRWGRSEQMAQGMTIHCC